MYIHAGLIGEAIRAANASFNEVLEMDISPLEKITRLTAGILSDSMKSDHTS